MYKGVDCSVGEYGVIAKIEILQGIYNSLEAQNANPFVLEVFEKAMNYAIRESIKVKKSDSRLLDSEESLKLSLRVELDFDLHVFLLLLEKELRVRGKNVSNNGKSI